MKKNIRKKNKEPGSRARPKVFSMKNLRFSNCLENQMCSINMDNGKEDTSVMN